VCWFFLRRDTVIFVSDYIIMASYGNYYKMAWQNLTNCAHGSPNHDCGETQIGKMAPFLACFCKFSKDLFLEVSRIFFASYLWTYLTRNAPKSWEQRRTNSLATIENPNCAKFTPQIIVFSWLWLQVWQKFTVNISCNIIALSTTYCAYLNCPAMVACIIKNRVHNTYATNVAKTNPRWPKWKRSWAAKLGFLKQKILVKYS